MKKLTTLLTTVILALTVVACSKGGGSINNPYSSSEIGNTITIGNIEWIVIEIFNDKALVLSDKILDMHAYHSTNEDITWENCDLREYLNGSFYDSTFSEDEKKLIIETENVNNSYFGNSVDRGDFSIPGGDNTMDKVFLLSKDEVSEYIVGDNVHLSIRDKRIARHIDTGDTGWWWSRSPGPDRDIATLIDDHEIVIFSFNRVNTSGGVRPALWIDLT